MTPVSTPPASLPLLALTALRSALFQIYFIIVGLLGSMAVYVVVFLFGYHELLVKGCVAWCSSVDWGIKNILGLHANITGKHNLPKGAYIVACRHQAAWEAILMPIWFQHSAIVLKEELLRVPFWGKCMQMFGAIPVARSRKASDLKNMLETAKKYAGENRALVIFPQGTRTKPGVRRPYQRGVGVLYEHLNIPVVPINLNSGCFWNRLSFLKFAGTVDVVIHPPIPAGLPRDEFLTRLEATLEVDLPPKNA